VIAGGLYSLMGPTVGAIITLSLTEGLRVMFGTNFIGAANTIYGVLLVVCIIFLPQGIVGKLQGIQLRRRPLAKPVEAPH
jgi:branched-chain amino acid transport system permease protein